MLNELEHALEDLLECFDTGGVIPTIDVIVNGEVVPGFVTEETIVRLEHAYDVLNGDPSGYEEDE